MYPKQPFFCMDVWWNLVKQPFFAWIHWWNLVKQPFFAWMFGEIWWNNHFLHGSLVKEPFFKCNDLESFNWNSHKKLVVWSSRYKRSLKIRNRWLAFFVSAFGCFFLSQKNALKRTPCRSRITDSLVEFAWSVDGVSPGFWVDPVQKWLIGLMLEERKFMNNWRTLCFLSVPVACCTCILSF